MEAISNYVYEKSLADRFTIRMAELNIGISEAANRLKYFAEENGLREYGRSALSQYLKGKYYCDTTQMEELLEAYLEATKQDIDIPGQVRPKTKYLESDGFVNTIGVCKLCQSNAALGLVVGKSGFGKTHALRKYAILSNVIYIECNEMMYPKDLIRRIEEGIGLPKMYGNIDERMERVKKFFSTNRGYLIIVDEADKLLNRQSQKKMEMLRAICDGTGEAFSESADVGLVLGGELILETTLKTYDERMANRIDFYYRFNRLSKSEVLKYIEGYDITEDAVAELIQRATNSRNGCFRLLDRTMNNVLRILKETNSTKITLNVIHDASNMMLL